MDYSIDDFINKRKELWERFKDIGKDNSFRNAVADELVKPENSYLREELSKNPEKLIELFFVIVDKDQATVPFFVNAVQKRFIEILNKDIIDYDAGKRNHLKYLVLKGRQQGFTSIINALQVAYAVLTPNFSGYTLADTSDNSQDIFSDKAKFYFDNLPDVIKPSIKYNTRRELDFNNDDSTGLNSKWRVATAGNTDTGRSKTINFFHGSECAFWKDSKNTLVGLSEAFTKRCIVILETTANGFNYYKELWDKKNNYKNLFFEWWLTDEYEMNFEDLSTRKDFLYKVDNGKDKEPDDAETEAFIFARLKWLRDSKGLNENKLYWYYNKWMDNGESIKQEYPCTDDEAFLASGRNFFPVSEVTRRLDEIKDLKPILKGYFTYKFTSSPITGEKLIVDDSITFMEDNSIGYIKIYKEHGIGERFVVSGDTAGDGSDWNAGHVLNAEGEEYASIHLIQDEDLFADQLYCLGIYFNKALLAVESNFSTYVNKTLQNRDYPNIYTRVSSPDNISQQTIEKLGFNTNKTTRPVLLGRLKELVREKVHYINDIETLKEMLKFVVNEKGKPEAIAGYHDDLIMAYGIGLYCNEQIPPEDIVKISIPDGFYTKEELEDLGYPAYMIRSYLANRSVKI